jgi:hypothetical protein
MSSGQLIAGVSIMALGVLTAGLIMNAMRGSSDLIAKAHAGFDSFNIF